MAAHGRRSLLSILAILLLVAVSCRSRDLEPAANPPAPEQNTLIGLALSSLYNPLDVSIQEGAVETASRLDVELVVREAHEDPDVQAAQIEELVNLGVDALIVDPVENETIVPALDAAGERGVPIFTVDRAANSTSVVSHIASDNVTGGQMAGSYLAETLGQEGSIVVLEGISGTSDTQDRGDGFREVMAGYPGIDIVAQTPADFRRMEGKAVFAEILSTLPRIDAVFAHSDEMILGAIEAATEAGRADEIVFVGFDAIDDALDAMESGQLQATIAQQPTEMGRLAVETAVQYLNGETVPAFIPVDLALITR